MNSIAFPKMFSGSSTLVNKDIDASAECLHLLVSTEEGEMFGDPEIGIKSKKFTFRQNDYVLKDILIDELYTKIKMFSPQIFINRENITITQEDNKLYAKVVVKNKKDFTTSIYNLVLMEAEE